MSWRTVVVSKRAKLDLKLGSVVIRSDDVVKVHLSEISTLIIENTAVSLTAALISELSKNKIKVIFCDEKRNPSSELVPYFGCHDTSIKVREQIKWTDEIKDKVWASIIREKLTKQRNLLKNYGLIEYRKIDEYILQIRDGDITNREGMAAKVYFHALFGMGFVRDENNHINAALNYGYGVLLSIFNREISACGYINQLGIHHDNMHNFFNLGCDLIEPFRVLVDEKVLALDFDEFTNEIKYKVLDVLNRQLIIANQKHILVNAIKIYCKSVFESLAKNNERLIRFYKDEL